MTDFQLYYVITTMVMFAFLFVIWSKRNWFNVALRMVYFILMLAGIWALVTAAGPVA